MQEQIQANLKTAMLARESLKVEVLKGLKTAIYNQQIVLKHDLDDDEIIAVVKKEVKKRHEAARLYGEAHANERKTRELEEAKILQEYLPRQLSDEELDEIVSRVIAEKGIDSPQKIGLAIGTVNNQVGASADGARIATAVKKKLGANDSN